MYFLDFEDFELAGASPESLVKVAAGALERGRSRAPARAADAPRRTRAARQELLADEKERAEHVMLVDLGRNDLGRVCESGIGAACDELMDVERYSHVMHIVSSGDRHAARRRRPRSTRCARRFPAGTLSGAPKIRAMQIIAELEPVERGPYGGAIGYFGLDRRRSTPASRPHAVLKDGRVTCRPAAGSWPTQRPNEVRETEEGLRGYGCRAVGV